MAPSREGGGSEAARLRRARAALGAALCLVAFEARADPYADVWATILLGVTSGLVACVVVELALGQGGWFVRAALGVFFAVVDLVMYLTTIGIWIQASVAGGSPSSSTYGPLIFATLLPWAVPAVRLAWLLHARSRRMSANPDKSDRIEG
jgi:hypothetical protein